MHTGFEIFPAAIETGRDPTGTLLCGIADPARVAPGAEQHRWSPLASRPGRQRPAIDRFATPGSAHDLERAHQGAEALVVVGAEEVEIGTRRAAADAETQTPSRQGLNRL